MMHSTPIIALSRRKQPQQSAGFTLIELLVAIMILTLLMSASLGAVRIASRSWEAGQSRADATEEMRASARFLRRQVAQLLQLTWADGNDERIAFVGETDKFRFVAPAPQHSHGAGYLIYEITAEKETDGRLLVLSYAPFDPGEANMGDRALAGQLLLGAGFADLSFEYYGAEMDDELVSWKYSWRPDAEFYPAAIRIQTNDDISPAAWPDLVLALRRSEET